MNHIPRMFAENFEVKVATILLKKLEKIHDLKNKIAEFSKQYKNVVFAISFAELGEEKWEAIKENLAYIDYFKKSNKTKEASYHEKNIDNIMNDWIGRIKKGEFYVAVNFDYEWNADFIERQNILGIDGLKRFLEEDVIPRMFPYGLDSLIRKDALWCNKQLRKKAVEGV